MHGGRRAKPRGKNLRLADALPTRPPLSTTTAASSTDGNAQARSPGTAVGRRAGPARRVDEPARGDDDEDEHELPRVPPRTGSRRAAVARGCQCARQEHQCRPPRLWPPPPPPAATAAAAGPPGVDLAPLPLVVAVDSLSGTQRGASVLEEAHRCRGRPRPRTQAQAPGPDSHLGPLHPARLRRPHRLAPSVLPRPDPPRTLHPTPSQPLRPERHGRRARLPDKGRPRPPASPPGRRRPLAVGARRPRAPVPRPALRTGPGPCVGRLPRRRVRPLPGRVPQGVRGARRLGRAPRPRSGARRRARGGETTRGKGGRDALPRHRVRRDDDDVGAALRRRVARAVLPPRHQGGRPRPVRTRVQEAVRVRRGASRGAPRRVERRARPAAHPRRERGVLGPRGARRQGRPSRHDCRVRDL